MKPVPPEKWAEWSAEQKRKDENKGSLVGGIERCLDDGITMISKHTIKVYAHNDLEVATSCINQWQSEGILEIIKPLCDANDEEKVIKMKAFIVARKPFSGNWPAYPFGKPTISN
jgi:hypothetical protein